jgi:hypothetical protein
LPKSLFDSDELRLSRENEMSRTKTNYPQLAIQLEAQRAQMMLRLRLLITSFLLFLLVINVLSVLTAIFFVGFGKMVLSETILLTLIGQTIAYSTASFLSITRFLFPVGNPDK